MFPEPLHPAVVHFPIVLMLIAPPAAIAASWAIHRGRPLRMWAWAILAAAALAGSAWVAAETGESQADTVEQVVGERLIEQHEDAAHLFTIAAAITLAVSLLGLARGKIGGAARALTVAGAVLVAVLGVRVGALGGDLVYRHGAAAAYVQVGAGPAEQQPTGRAGSDDGPRER